MTSKNGVSRKTAGLGGWIFRRAQRTPDAIAIIESGRPPLSYLALGRSIQGFSQSLQQMGITRGSTVAFLGENSSAYIISLFAVTSLGAVFVPVNTRLAVPEVAYILSDSAAQLLINDFHLDELAAKAAQSAKISHRISVGSDLGTADVLFDDALKTNDTIPTVCELDITDPAMIMYTSGTTGSPKGAVLSHENLTWNAMNVIIDYDISADEVTLIIAPMFHTAALGMGALPTLLKGGTLILESKFDPERVLTLIEKHRVSMLSGVPTTFQMLVEQPQWETTDSSSLSKITCGGSPAPHVLIEQLQKRGISFSQGYGMTEASPGTTMLHNAMSFEKSGSVGLPHFFTRIKVVTEDGSPARAYEVGEILISGPNVMDGYHNLPPGSSEAFSSDGWFKSGDAGYLDDDGYLYISGRIKDMIISGGENIYPAEIELLILQHADVLEVAVIGIPDQKWGEVPLAIITLKEGSSFDAETVKKTLSESVAKYKVPKEFIVVDEMPKTSTGKIQKNVLRERWAG